MNATTTHDDSRAPAANKRTERTCAGCGQHARTEELVRVIHDPVSGELAVDLAGGAFGRGGHVHPSPACVAKAVKSGFARVFKAAVVADAGALGEALVAAADRRIEGLLGGARRAGQLVVGADLVAESLADDRAALVVVARDAAAAAKLSQVERAVVAGKAIAWGSKQVLGAVTNRGDVAVVAIVAPGVAAAIAHTYGVSGPFRVASCTKEAASADAQHEKNEEAWSSSEVR